MADRFPPQVKYIIGNEGCERFSFYGMRSILTVYLVSLGLSQPHARANFHLFVMGVYFFPLLGGYLADRFLGKYHTIFWLSLLYCAGHACLALFDQQLAGFYTGLLLIALGSGGIKPCVSAFVGDQFRADQRHLVRRVYGLFYWMVNFGSFFASLSIPKTLEWYGPKVAFGIPGILMAIATLVFWLGRKRYKHVPPTGRDPHSFVRVLWDALRLRASRARGQHFLDPALARHPVEAVEGCKSVLRVLVIFAPIPVFWALFDQKASLWVLQAATMDLQVGPFTLAASQLQALNPMLVMLIIPLNELVIYPWFERHGFTLTPLRRMTVGMFVAGVSFLAAGTLQLVLDDGVRLSVLWQAIPYVLLTFGEVLVSATGLEFAYREAPTSMKGTIMSFWLLTTSVGNLLVAGIAALNVFQGAAVYLFFAGLIFVAGAVFALLARRHVSHEYFQSA